MMMKGKEESKKKEKDQSAQLWDMKVANDLFVCVCVCECVEFKELFF